jgi:hypothetical protein
LPPLPVVHVWTKVPHFHWTSTLDIQIGVGTVFTVTGPVRRVLA